MPGIGCDNLRHMVRFAAAVRAALEEGYRVFAELAPHPLLTHAVEQTARSLDMPLAALAGMRREQALPYGLRGFVADLHSAGAAVDFSVLYPNGRLVDAPLPTWTHRRLLLSRGGQESPTHGGCTVSVHPLLGAHVRLQEEPERHVWQAEVGTAAQPWLGDHRIRNVAVLPGAAYCEMALAAARAVLGEASEVRDIRFEQALLLDEQTTVGASAALSSPGVVDFTVETNQGGEQARQATAVLHAAEEEQPPAQDMSALLAAHPRREDGAEVRKRLDQRGVQYGPAFTGLAAVHTGEGATGTVLVEVALPGQIRSQQDAYGVHPALLDACFQSVAAHPEVQALGEDVLALPLGIRRLRSYGSARSARYCYTRVTKADTSGVEADLDVLDEHGAVLLAVQGLRLGTGASENGHNDRVLAKRLLTIEWRQRELPEVEHADAGTWLLISTTTADVVATTLTDALKNHGAHCTTMCWPPHADHTSNAEQLGNHLRAGGFTGVVILTGPKNGDADDQSPLLGREYVQHLVRITRELPEIPGELPRLYVVTRNAQTVAGQRRGQSGAGWAAGLDAGDRHRTSAPARHPDRCGRSHRCRAAGAATARRVRGGRDRLAKRRSGTRRGCAPLRCAPRSGRPPSPTMSATGCVCRSARPVIWRRWNSLPATGFRRDRGRSRSRSARPASTSPTCWSRSAVTPAFEGRLPQLGMDFAGVVTAVGPDVTDHKVGDRVGGSVRRRLLGHVRHLRRAPGRHAAGRTDRRPGGGGADRDTPPPGTACTSWPGSRPATRC